MALVIGIELLQLHKSTGAKPVISGSGRNELPHSFGYSEPGGRTACSCIEVALHQGKVEELGRHAVSLHGLRDLTDIAVLFGEFDGPAESGRRFPFCDVIKDIIDKGVGHRYFTFAESAGDRE